MTQLIRADVYLRRIFSIVFGVASLVGGGCGGGGGDSAAVPESPPPVVIAPTPAITVLAGNIGGAGSNDGVAARFNQPIGLALDARGDGYVADSQNHTIRKVADGRVVTIAGLAGSRGHVDGEGGVARFFTPTGVTVDNAGNIYVAEYSNKRVRKITPTGLVTTLAGGGTQCCDTDGVGVQAQFNSLTGIAVDTAGNVYVTDVAASRIRRISPAGVVTTVAGSSAGLVDGIGRDAKFSQPAGIAIAPNGDLYVADRLNHNIRKITSSHVVSTFAGADFSSSLAFGMIDGPGSAARFNTPTALVFDKDGALIVLDNGNGALRKVTMDGVVTTVSTNNYRFDAQLLGGLTIDRAGTIYVSEPGRNIITAVSPSGGVATLQGASAKSGFADGAGSNATFKAPAGVTLDTAGNAYVVDADNATIRKISATGEVSTLAGSPGVFGIKDGTGAAAQFFQLSSVARAADGNLYVTDTLQHFIRKVTPAGVVSTIAGQTWPDGTFVSTSRFTGYNVGTSNPVSVAVDGNGVVYVLDGYAIRRITTGNPDGILNCIRGCYGTNESVTPPRAIVVDSTGSNIYVAEAFGIRRISLAGDTGVMTDLAGDRNSAGFADGTGAEASFNLPSALALDAVGNIYVADTGNNAIRKVTPAGVVTTVVGRSGALGTIPGALSGSVISPKGIAVGSDGILLVTSENAVLKIQQ